jgi:hypothetical protein
MKWLALMFLASISLKSIAQTDTSKVEQYCEVMGIQKFMSKKCNITVDYGEATSIWKDLRIKDEKGKVETFNSLVDALNFMALQGWTLLNAFAYDAGGQNVYHFYFKKMFLRSDLQTSTQPK